MEGAPRSEQGPRPHPGVERSSREMGRKRGKAVRAPLKAPTITHEITLKQIQQWLDSGCNSEGQADQGSVAPKAYGMTERLQLVMRGMARRWRVAALCTSPRTAARHGQNRGAVSRRNRALRTRRRRFRLPAVSIRHPDGWFICSETCLFELKLWPSGRITYPSRQLDSRRRRPPHESRYFPITWTLWLRGTP